jgi:hypothetical protein
LSRVQWRPTFAGYLAKAALGQQNCPANFVSGRERVSLADHARGVNWLTLSQGGSGKTGEPADSAVLLAKCAMALAGEAETGFRVFRATLAREKSLRGIWVRLRGAPVDFSGGKDPFRIRWRASEDGHAMACPRPGGQRWAKLPAGRSRTRSACGSRIRRGHDRQSARNRRFPRPAGPRRIAQARAKRSRCLIEARRPAPVCQSQGKRRWRNSKLKQKYRANSFAA